MVKTPPFLGGRGKSGEITLNTGKKRIIRGPIDTFLRDGFWVAGTGPWTISHAYWVVGAAAATGLTMWATLTWLPVPQKKRTTETKNPLTDAFEPIIDNEPPDDTLPTVPPQPPSPIDITLVTKGQLGIWIDQAEAAGAFMVYNPDLNIVKALIGPPFVAPSGYRLVSRSDLLSLQSSSSSPTIPVGPSDPWDGIGWVDLTGIESDIFLQSQWVSLGNPPLCYNPETGETRAITSAPLNFTCPSPWIHYNTPADLDAALGLSPPSLPTPDTGTGTVDTDGGKEGGGIQNPPPDTGGGRGGTTGGGGPSVGPGGFSRRLVRSLRRKSTIMGRRYKL